MVVAVWRNSLKLMERTMAATMITNALEEAEEVEEGITQSIGARVTKQSAINQHGTRPLLSRLFPIACGYPPPGPGPGPGPSPFGPFPLSSTKF